MSCNSSVRSLLLAEHYKAQASQVAMTEDVAAVVVAVEGVVVGVVGEVVGVRRAVVAGRGAAVTKRPGARTLKLARSESARLSRMVVSMWVREGRVCPRWLLRSKKRRRMMVHELNDTRTGMYVLILRISAVVFFSVISSHSTDCIVLSSTIGKKGTRVLYQVACTNYYYIQFCGSSTRLPSISTRTINDVLPSLKLCSPQGSSDSVREGEREPNDRDEV